MFPYRRKQNLYETTAKCFAAEKCTLELIFAFYVHGYKFHVYSIYIPTLSVITEKYKSTT